MRFGIPRRDIASGSCSRIGDQVPQVMISARVQGPVGLVGRPHRAWFPTMTTFRAELKPDTDGNTPF